VNSYPSEFVIAIFIMHYDFVLNVALVGICSLASIPHEEQETIRSISFYIY